MIELYEEKGFSKEEATDIMNILVKNKEYFVDHMMVQVWYGMVWYGMVWYGSQLIQILPI